MGIFRSPQFFRATSVQLPSKRTMVCLRQDGGGDGRVTLVCGESAGRRPSLAAAVAALSCRKDFWWVRVNGNWQTRFTRKPWRRQPVLGAVVRAELFRQVAYGRELREDLTGAAEHYQNVLLETGKTRSQNHARVEHSSILGCHRIKAGRL